MLIALLSASVYFSLKNKFEEDITKILPKDKKTESMSDAFSHSKFSERIIVNISSKNDYTEKLIDYSDKLTEILEKEHKPELIKEIKSKFSQESFFNIFDLIISSLPVFLDDKDLEQIERSINPDEIDKKMQNNLNVLVSPAGAAMKKFIISDPLSFSSVVLKKLSTLNINENYILENERIFTKDKKNLIFFITPSNAASETAKNTVLFDSFDEIIEKFEKDNPGLKIDYFGASAVAVGNAKQLKKDIMLTVILSMFGIFFFVIWFYKNIKIAFISFLPAIFGGACSLAMIFFIQGKLSSIALGAGSIILGIIVDYSFYIYNSYLIKKDSEKVIREMSFTLLICSLTTATAFFSLLFVKSQVLHDLGIFAGLSIIAAALFTLIALPHLLETKNVNDLEQSRIPIIFTRILNYPFHKKPLLIISMFLFAGLSAFFAGRVHFETDMNNMNFMTEQLSQMQERMSKEGETALKAVYILSKGKTADESIKSLDLAMPKIYNMIENKVISSFTSPNRVFVSDSVQKIRIKRWHQFWTKERRSSFSAEFNKISDKYKFRNDLVSNVIGMIEKDYSAITIDTNKIVLSSFLNEFISESKGNKYITSIIKLDQKDKASVINQLSGINNISVFDKQTLTNTLVDNIRIDFDLLVKLSLILVSVVLILSFGRFELGLIVSVPMFFSWLLTLGFMGIAGIKFNIFNIIISTFIFGLGTDYSILMMRGLQQKFKYGEDEMFSYKSSIFVSAMTTIIGVGVLITARHPALNSIALISVFGMISVVLSSWTLQPVMFYWLLYSRKGKRSYPLTLINIIATGWTQFLFFVGCIIGFVLGHFVFTLIPGAKNNRFLKYCYHFMMAMLCGTDVWANFHIRKRFYYEGLKIIEKPAVIICNHQSHIDIPFMIMMNPKLILLTNDWVWNSPFFGSVIRFADYYPTAWGYENSIELLRSRVAEGYSIVVFPEGTRSKSGEIGRFHKGAFFIAEQLNLDILPVLLHGSGMGITKGEVAVKKTTLSMKFLNLIKNNDLSFGETYQERTKKIAEFFKVKYSEFASECETPEYFKDKVIKNFIYKGPILEWYVRSKLSLEDNYKELNSLLPQTGKIVDIGCGYGYADFMFAFLSKDREILAMDFDEQKINLAKNCHIQPENLTFRTADILNVELPESDAFILSDILHYLPEKEQENVLIKCLEKLNLDGRILIRDSNQDLKIRSYGTKYTEIFSTTFGFNKAKYSDMHFVTKKVVDHLAKKMNLKLTIYDNSKLTSNFLYIIERNNAI